MTPISAFRVLVVAFAAASCVCAVGAVQSDPRLREVAYDPVGVIAVPVKRGTVTLIVLGADEAIAEVASGLGADCAKPDAAWCVAAQAGGRTIFVKPKTGANTGNNLAVVTDRRTHTFRFDVLADNDARPAVYRLIVRPPAPQRVPSPSPVPRLPLLAIPELLPPAPPPPKQVVAARLLARAQVVNTQYSIAEGARSEDIVPTLVFDDGRFTYLRFPGNREVPAVFHVLGDGSETLVNARMEDELLVIDRVSRRLMLRAGNAVVGLWNDAFDLEGNPPDHATTIPGVERALKASPAAHPGSSTGDRP